jgi:hypothetical protein
MSDEKLLIKFLLDHYEMVGVTGRPVLNTSDTIKVDCSLALIQILDVDERNQVLTTNVWNRYVSYKIDLLDARCMQLPIPAPFATQLFRSFIPTIYGSLKFTDFPSSV